MGLFSKKECCICSNTIKGSYSNYGKWNENKYVCKKCLRTLHAEGFDNYRSDCGKMIESPDLIKAYSEYYNSIVNNEAYDVHNSDIATKLTVSIGRLIINKNFITVCGYDDLFIRTNDVTAVVVESAIKYSDFHLETLIVTIFTNNPLVPYVTTAITGKVDTLFSGKAKELREHVTKLLTAYFNGLRYPVSSAKELKKLVKKDDNYSGGCTKKEMLDAILSAETQFGFFSCKNAEKGTDECNQPNRLLLSMGYGIYVDDTEEYIFENQSK